MALCLGHQKGFESSINCLPDDVLHYIAIMLVEQTQGPIGDGRMWSFQELRNFTEVCKTWCKTGRAAATRIRVQCQRGRLTDYEMGLHVGRLLTLFPNGGNFSLCSCEIKRVTEEVDLEGLGRAVRHLELRYCDQGDEYEKFGLPGSLAKWEKLESLSTSSHVVPVLPEEIRYWTLLRRLSINDCGHLTTVPDAVQNWSMLSHVDLHWCPWFQDLPKGVAGWTNLRELSLVDFQGIRTLPKEVKSWTRLERLRLSGASDFESFPEEIGAWGKLRILVLNDCEKLKGLPQSAVKWNRLEQANLEQLHRQFELLRYVEGWKSLKVFVMGMNEATIFLPEEVGKWKLLERLEIYCCPALQGLPEFVGEWRSLGELRISNCSSFASLPNNVRAWNNLETLRLRELPMLDTLPEGFRKWSFLRFVKIECCRRLKPLSYYIEGWKLDQTAKFVRDGVLAYTNDSRSTRS